MKRKNLILKQSFLFIILGILFLFIIHFIDTKIANDIIGTSFFQTVKEGLSSTNQTIELSGVLDSDEEQTDFVISQDVSALYIQGDRVREIGTHAESASLSNFIENNFLKSELGLALLEEGEDILRPIRLREPSDDVTSVYILINFIDGSDEVLLLTKNISVWDVYLWMNRFVIFVLVLTSLFIMLSFYYHLTKRIYAPIVEITETGFEYAEYNFDKKIGLKSSDEIGNLATMVSKLGKTLEASTIMNKKERTLLEHVFEALSVGVIHIDEEWVVTSLNKTGQHYYSNNMRLDSDSIQKKMKVNYETAIRTCFETGTGQRMEVQHNQLIFDLRFSPILIPEENHITGILILIEEITSAKRLVSIREDLITNVSHDFRTPLASIRGYSEAIADDIAETVEEKNEMARIIQDEASQLNQMITKLLDHSRMKAGYLEMDFDEVNVNPFFTRLFLRFEDILDEENIKYSLTIQDGIEFIQVDENRMHQVLYNLIDNAIRYAANPNQRDHRFIQVEVKLAKLLDKLLIVISDNGIGISEESIPYIFERFYKDDKARTRPKTNGSGIGLSIVYTIIEEHEGTIQVQSKVNTGTTFTIQLPYEETNFGDIEEIPL